jgi:hypothetical protein
VYTTAATNAEAGSVTIQAITMLIATCHRTAESLRLAPTPKTEPEMTWVVLTGIPKWLAVMITAAPEASAANPCTGSSRMIRRPTVLMIR